MTQPLPRRNRKEFHLCSLLYLNAKFVDRMNQAGDVVADHLAQRFVFVCLEVRLLSVEPNLDFNIWSIHVNDASTFGCGVMLRTSRRCVRSVNPLIGTGRERLQLSEPNKLQRQKHLCYHNHRNSVSQMARVLTIRLPCANRLPKSNNSRSLRH
jgi:hypothetical protein